MYSLLVKTTCKYFIIINIQFLFLSRLSSSTTADSNEPSSSESSSSFSLPSSPELPLTLGLVSSASLYISRLKPTIQIAVPIHAFSKAKVLPFTLSAIEGQDYPKNRIKIYLYFELFHELIDLSSKSKIDLLQDNPKYARNLLTYQTIKSWIEANRHLYKDIILHIDYLHDDDDETSDISEEGQSSYWNKERFKKIIQLKTLTLHHAIDNWVDHLFLVDCDVILVNNNTLSSLVDDNQPLVAPMLYSLGTYSNFWAGMDEKGYYVRTEDYLPILERYKLGLFKVPMIHSCVLIDLRMEQVNALTFNGSMLNNVPYDDIIAFALSAKYAGVPMFISNKQIWGYIMPPIDVMSLNSLDQDLIDLQLESSIDGYSFPVAKSLIQFTDRLSPKKDKLGMDEIYTINLKRRPERLNRMMERLDLLGVDTKVWPAVDGKKLSENYLIENNIAIMDGYVDPYHKRPMTFGEIGCFLSHHQIWQEVVEKNYSKVIIFEDDIKFERAFRARWLKRLELLEEFISNGGEVDLVYLGRKPQGSRAEEKAPVEGFVYPEYSYWTIGYMLTSTGARKLLDTQPLQKLIPVDEYFPILFDKHPETKWSEQFPNRTVIAFSVHPLLIYPTHFVGDAQYTSDTENSSRVDEIHNTHTEMHFEL